MTVWKCVTHNIRITEDGKARQIETPPHSIRGMPPCQILTMFEIKEGQAGECQIVKET